jgi:hydrogenase-4 component E
VILISECAAACFLLSTFWLLGTRFFLSQLLAYQVQSWALALFAGLLAAMLHEPSLYLIALLTVGVRGLWIPHLLRQAAQALPSRREQLWLSIPSSIVLGAALLMIAVYLSFQLLGPNPATQITGSAGFGLVLLGFFLTSSRPEAFPQALGIFTIENGIFLLALAIAPTFPFLFEGVVLLDLLVLSVVLRLLIQVLAERLQNLLTHHLRELRG